MHVADPLDASPLPRYHLFAHVFITTRRPHCRRPATSRSRTAQEKTMTTLTEAGTPTTYMSPLHQMTQTTPTCLWNDSASIEELTYSIQHGGVGATCNPVIVLGVLKKEMPQWRDRIKSL